MKKLIILVLILGLLGCKGQYIKPGNYAIVNKNERPIYLIDINSGERLVELHSGKFFIKIPEGKRVASFSVAFTNFNSESASIRHVELGFFNGKVKTTSQELPGEAISTSIDAIIIQPDCDLESGENGEIVGKTLSAYGPILYYDYRSGYYYFYIGINYLRVKESGATLIKKPEGEGGQVFDGEIEQYAYGFLTYEWQMMIDDISDFLAPAVSIDSQGITVSNKEFTREYTIANLDVIVVTFYSLHEENLQLSVYLDANTYSFLGLRLITVDVPEPDEPNE